MELQELRCFQQVASLGSLSRASVQLGLTQPSLSRQIQKLEAEFGAKLFYRNGRGVTLTATGQRLLDGAAELLADAARLRQDIADHAKHVSGSVVIGMPPSFCSAIGAGLASGFRDAYPGISLRIYEHFSATLLEWICSARLDFAILYDVRRTPSLLVSPLFNESLFLVGPANKPMPETRQPISALLGRDLVLPCTGSGLRKVIQHAAARADIDLKVVLELDSVAAIKQLVEDGAGDTVLPYGAIHRELREGRLRACELDPAIVSAKLVMATPALQPVTAATHALADFLTAKVAHFAQSGVLRGTVLGPRPGGSPIV